MSANQQVLGGLGTSSADIGDNIAYSLMLDSASSQYLSRTFGAPTNRRKWTVFHWLKRGVLSTAQTLMGTTTVLDNFTIAAGNSIKFDPNNAASYTTDSSDFLRDPAKWCLVMLAFDSTQATAANRTRIYVNNLQITDTYAGAYAVPLNYDPELNKSGCVAYIGAKGNTTQYSDCYMAMHGFVDGQQLTPTDVGRVSADTGQFVPKSSASIISTVTGVGAGFGVNGHLLDFAEAGATAGSNAGLGKDVSGNGNYWTTNGGISSANQYTDTPTNSYCVLNPLYPNTSSTYSKGNTTATTSTTRQHYKGSMPLPSTGQWYWECRRGNASASGYQLAGITLLNTAVPATPNPYYPTGVWGYGNSGYKADNGTQTTGLTSSALTTDVWGFKYDADADTFDCYLNNASICSFTGLTGEYVPYMGTETGCTVEMLFGQAVNSTGVSYDSGSGGYFEYSPGSTYKALCTANLPTPAIIKPALHFNAKTRTGTGATYSVTGELFQPDLVWTKGRSGATDHALYDSVRGVQKQLESNTTTAESTEATGLTAFNSDGYTAGSLAQMNTNAATYIDWMFKAGGAAVSNTSGSITSSVSANTTAGISIVTYTGTGANATVGHGLGVAPKLVIAKNRSIVAAWRIHHTSLSSAANTLYFDTSAQTAAATDWNSTFPTSTVFSLGSNNGINGNGNSCVALCFAEVEGFSKIGSYTGNADANGTFVYCGFKPRFILIRGTTATHWVMVDTARNTYNVVGYKVAANDASAENFASLGGVTENTVDAVSNGFKARSVNGQTNNSGTTYIFYAIAEAPMKYATAR